MSEQTDDFGPQCYLVGTAMMFGGREFTITVGHDGFSYWFDSFAYHQALKSDPGLVAMSAIPDSDERKFLSQIYDEWTVKVEVPEMELREMRDHLAPRYWSDDSDKDFGLGKRLKEILEPIFWRDINSQLSLPITPDRT